MNVIKNPVARKPHLCDWCPEKIEVGTKYTTVSGIWEGDFFHTRWHGECYSAVIRNTDYGDEFCMETHARGGDCDAH